MASGNWESELIPALVSFLSSLPGRRASIQTLRQRFVSFRAQWQRQYKSFAAFAAAHAPVFITSGDSVELNPGVTVRATDNLPSRPSQRLLPEGTFSAPASATPSPLDHGPSHVLTTKGSLAAHSAAQETRSQLFALRDRLHADARPPHPNDAPVIPRRAKSGPLDLQELRESDVEARVPPSKSSVSASSDKAHKRSASSDKDTAEPGLDSANRLIEDWEAELIASLTEYLSSVAPRGSEDIHVLTAKFGQRHRVGIYHKYRKFRTFLQSHAEMFEIDARDQVGLSHSTSPRHSKPKKSASTLALHPAGPSGAHWEAQLLQGLVKFVGSASVEWSILASAFPQFRGHIKYSYGSFKSFLLHHPAVFRLAGENVSVASSTAPVSPPVGVVPLSTDVDAQQKNTTPRGSHPAGVPSLVLAGPQRSSPPVSSGPSPRASAGKPATAPIAIPPTKQARRMDTGSSSGEASWTSSPGLPTGSSADSDTDLTRASALDRDDVYSGDDSAHDADHEAMSPTSDEGDADSALEPTPTSPVLSSTPTSSTTFGLSSPLDEAAADAPPPVAPAYRPKFRPALRVPGSPSSKKTAQFALPSKPVMPSFTFFPRPETKVRSSRRPIFRSI